jgi:8-oxo-dGTP pyrophosphatase MutT (NUDIX family)
MTWGRFMSFHEKSCGAIVFKRNGEIQYLLLHYEAGHWDYVKGQVEPHESEKDTVSRELEEETGITNAHFVEGFREEINYFYKRERRTVYKEVIFFLVESKDSNVKLSYEHVGYEWHNYEKAMAKLTFPNAKKVLAKAHEFLREHETRQAS